MKMCAKCHAEYPDDMAFCSYCGTPLQPKIEERVCPACGKTVHADNLRFCPYCGYSFTSLETKKPSNTKPPLPPDVNIKKNYVKMQPLNQENKPSINEANKSVSTTESNESNSGNSESSSGGFLKSALTIIGVIFLMGFSKACGRILYHGTTGSQKGFFIGVVFAGIVGGIIPAIVANKYCKFDNPSTAVWLIFILQIIVSFLSAYQIVPIGSIPIGIILAILLYLFNKK